MVSTSVLNNVQNMSDIRVVVSIALCCIIYIVLGGQWTCVHHGQFYVPCVIYQLVHMITLPAFPATEAWWQLKRLSRSVSLHSDTYVSAMEFRAFGVLTSFKTQSRELHVGLLLMQWMKRSGAKCFVI